MQTETIQDGNAVDANVAWAIERWLWMTFNQP